MRNAQLADLLRPQSIDDIVGQEHLFGERGVIRRMLAGGRLTNMIFFGPPGTGKTTAASIIARESGMDFHKLNATSASTADVKEVLSGSASLLVRRELFFTLMRSNILTASSNSPYLSTLRTGA